MEMSITHNLIAMNAGRMLRATGRSKAKSTEKLSSGYKINRAADDAAGLAISEKMRRQIRGLTQGVQNTQEAVSLCHVADGALAEVDEMLHRITELSIKSANATNSDEDREAIHQEVTQLLSEINRIGDTTEFNDIYIFKGTDTVMYGPDGSVITEGSIPFSDFTIADVDLGYSPFNASSNSNALNLQAVVNNPDSIADGMSYGLVYGNGVTSHSSIRLQYNKDGGPVTQEISFDDLTPQNYVSGTDADGKPFWTRDLVYQNDDGVSIKITQKIVADDTGTTEKNYNMSYSFENTGTVDVGMDFMFHTDTAYNNNDRCEGYFSDGNRIDESCIYSSSGSVFTDGQTNPNIYGSIPDSFSIVDVDRALAFSEKITFTSGKPDSLSIGYYNDIHRWSYYNTLDSHLGQNMVDNDLGFGLMWHFDMSAGDSEDVGFDYGISALESDQNLRGVDLTVSSAPLVDHDGEFSLWIHSNSEPGVGIWLELQEMNAGVLGISNVDLTTAKGAEAAIEPVKKALGRVAKLRSMIGAQQNRLEHTIANEDNVVENTTSAESRIRDTDIATEMVKYSNHNILEQAGASMLTQANQQPNYIMQLLQ